MSYSVDVNLLLYASNAACDEHEKASCFVAGLQREPDVLCLALVTLMSYLRISTHGSIFRSPLSPEEALENVESLLALPRARIIGEEEGFFSAYREVTAGLQVRGNLVPDAHLATILRQNGVKTLFTADPDFHRFRFLEVRNPLR